MGRFPTIGYIAAGLVSLAVLIVVAGLLLSGSAWGDITTALEDLRLASQATPIGGVPEEATPADKNSPSTGPAKAAPGAPSARSATTVPIGEPLAIGSWQLLVNDARIDDSFTLLKAGRFVVIDWTLKNTNARGAFVEIGGPPDPNRLTLSLRDTAGREGTGWLYNQTGSLYTFMAAPGDVMRTQYYFRIGDGALEDVELVVRFPQDLSNQEFLFNLTRRASKPVELLPTPLAEPVGVGKRFVVADRWAFTIHGIDLNAGEDGGERIVKVDLTAENLQQQARLLGETERAGSAERRDFYLVDQHGYVAYSRADQMPQDEIGPGESMRVTLWLYTHDLAPRGRYRLSLILDWQANQYASFDLGDPGSQVTH